jgi:tRNA (uracil-5-)-methyltransferase
MPLSRVMPESYDSLLSEKVHLVKRLLAEFSPPEPTVFPSCPTGFRMRAEFRMWSENGELNYVMFPPGDSKTPVVVTDFPIGCEKIQRVMPVLLEQVRKAVPLRKRLFQVEFLASLSGDLVITLVYHRQLDMDWEHAASQLLNTLKERFTSVSIVGRSRGQKVVLGYDYVQEVLRIHGRDYRFKQYEQSFSQPNGRINARMIEWACTHAGDEKSDLLELYCGHGNFTLPLSLHFKNVIATETAKVSVRCAIENLNENAVQNVQVVRMSAEEVSQAIDGVRTFRRLGALPKPLGDYNLCTLFVDPPRAGLDSLTLAIARRFPTIVYMSCNAQTLAENLRALIGSHRIAQFALFDQFPYTDHIECGVVLQRS